jgi:acyl-CoA synthetase (AMP-forming)/AMP-acid ligase II
MNIPSLLERAVDLYPNKEALVSGKKRFTYAQFSERVQRFTQYLGSVGINRGDCVAILHPNSHEYLEAYFAVAHCGAILNPLNVRLSPREIAHILKDSGARLLVTSPQYVEAIETVILAETILEKVIWTGAGDIPSLSNGIRYEDLISERVRSPLPKLDFAGDEVAHLYYTSGTTGLPKGVMLTHKNVCTHALAAIAELHITDQDNWLHVAPLFHLADAWATFAITWVGGKHITLDAFVPQKVLSTIQQEKITLTNMIPTMLNRLVHTEGAGNDDYSDLRLLMSGGSPIAPDLVMAVMETFKCDYVQTYGMTETSPYLTLSILKENILSRSKEEQFIYKAKTGRPFLGVQMKVVREDGTAVRPDGKEVGEIMVKGDIVTPGYWRQPEETAKAFKDGWLQTGDLAVLDKEGYINIVDRKKDMIITGGENVYSVEVENVIYSHPAVMEVAVIGVPDPEWGEAVKAVVVMKPGKEAGEDEIIAYCKNRLAAYKSPKSIDFVQELPKTGSGKLYKKGLKEKVLAGHGH